MKLKFQIRAIFFYLIFIIAVLQITSCKKVPVQLTQPSSAIDNRPPVTNAGVDQTITLSSPSIGLHVNHHRI